MKRKSSPRTRKLTVLLLVIAMLFSFAPSGFATNDTGVESGVYIGGDVLTYYTWGQYSLGETWQQEQIADEITQAGFLNVNFVEDGKIANLRDILDNTYTAAQRDFVPGDLEEEYTRKDGTPIYPPQPEVIKDIVGVEAVTRTAEYGSTEAEALALLPDEVTADLDDGSSVVVEVDWADEIPGFDGTDEGAEYTVSGDLVDLPAGVENPNNYPASATITVGAADFFYVDDQEDTKLIDAKNAQAERIVLRNNIVINNRFVIDWTTEIDLNGFSITLDGGMLAVTGDNITIENGAIFGELTWWPWNGPEEINLPDNYWRPWDPEWTSTSWVDWRQPFSERVMVSGSNVTFDAIAFNVDIADWYQYQGDTDATGLVISNSTLNGLSLFVSDVTLEGNVIANRVGIEHDDAHLEENTLIAASLVGLYGILYINSDAYLLNNTWADNFTGMYVGKSLKYYGEEAPDGYSEAKPTVDGATIITDKYGLVWWAINYFKAELHVTGDVDMTSTPILGGKHSGPALMLVGTCYQDYQEEGLVWPDGKIDGLTGAIDEDNYYDGGKVLGDATFTGADVWFGKPTAEFLAFSDKNYEGEVYYKHDLCDKNPACIKYVDYQACKKDADRLYIHGPKWEATVHIFTPANDYIGCERVDELCNQFYKKDGRESEVPLAPFADPVWLGDGEYDLIRLWGDFNIINRKTVDFNQIIVECDNIRRIGTEEDLTGDCACRDLPGFVRGGTLRGGTILSGTCEDGVLVFGDGLLVENVVVDALLRNLILETTKLEGVDLNVGEPPTNNEREVCGTELAYDVTVWPRNNATFSNVMWSANTRVEVRDYAKMSFEGDIDNQGTIKFQTYAFIGIDGDAIFTDDIRPEAKGRNVTISEADGFGYISVNYGSFGRWSFNGWKADAVIQADGIISAKYEFKVEYCGNEYRRIVDLRNPDNYDWIPRLREGGVLLTEILGLDDDTFPLSPGKSIDIRITVCRDSLVDSGVDSKTIDFTVTGYFINCCTQRFMPFSSTETITLLGKTIQVPCFTFIDQEAVLDCEDQELFYVVNYTVENTGNKKGTDDVRLYVQREEDGPWYQVGYKTHNDLDIGTAVQGSFSLISENDVDGEIVEWYRLRLTTDCDTVYISWAEAEPTCVASVVLTPDEATITAGESQQFIATARDAFNRPTAVSPELGFEWEVKDGPCGHDAYVDSDGVFYSTTAGSFTVEVTYTDDRDCCMEATATTTATVTVTPAECYYFYILAGPADAVGGEVITSEDYTPGGPSIQVEVTDQWENPIPNITVMVSVNQNEISGGDQSQYTNEDGIATFNDLVINDYATDYVLTFVALCGDNPQVVSGTFKITQTAP